MSKEPKTSRVRVSDSPPISKTFHELYPEMLEDEDGPEPHLRRYTDWFARGDVDPDPVICEIEAQLDRDD